MEDVFRKDPSRPELVDVVCSVFDSLRSDIDRSQDYLCAKVHNAHSLLLYAPSVSIPASAPEAVEQVPLETYPPLVPATMRPSRRFQYLSPQEVYLSFPDQWSSNSCPTCKSNANLVAESELSRCGFGELMLEIKKITSRFSDVEVSGGQIRPSWAGSRDTESSLSDQNADSIGHKFSSESDGSGARSEDSRLGVKYPAMATVGQAETHLSRRVGGISLTRRYDVDVIPTKDGGRGTNAVSRLCMKTSAFDMASIFCVLLSMMMMAIETQYKGWAIGVELGQSSPYAHTMPYSVSAAFVVIEWVVGISFFIEIAFKLAVLGKQFWCSVYNLLDLVIFILWLLERLFFHVSSNAILLRIFRGLRCIRLFKALVMIQALDSMHVLLGSLAACRHACFFSFAVIFLLQILVALLLSHLMQATLVDPSQSLEMRVELYEYFGTFSKAVFTTMTLTYCEWGPTAHLLYHNVDNWCGWVVVLYALVVNFAVIQVVSAVITHETFRVASTDSSLMIVQARRNLKQHSRLMEDLFIELDRDGDDCIDQDEFQYSLRQPKMQMMFSAMDMEAGDAAHLFRLLDNGNGQLTLKELLRGLERLKGPARSIDLASLSTKVSRLETILTHRITEIAHNVSSLRHSGEASAEKRI